MVKVGRSILVRIRQLSSELRVLAMSPSTDILPQARQVCMNTVDFGQLHHLRKMQFQAYCRLIFDYTPFPVQM